MTDKPPEEIQQESVAIPFEEFLESTPPSSLIHIDPLTRIRRDPLHGHIQGYEILNPEIQLHCPEETCNGTRFFRCTESSLPDISTKSFTYFYMTYMCWNCQKTEKTFSLAAKANADLTRVSHERSYFLEK